MERDDKILLDNIEAAVVLQSTCPQLAVIRSGPSFYLPSCQHCWVNHTEIGLRRGNYFEWKQWNLFNLDEDTDWIYPGMCIAVSLTQRAKLIVTFTAHVQHLMAKAM